MSTEDQIKKFVDDVTVDYKSISGKIGNLTTLPTGVDKTSLVAALVSLNNKIAAAAGINDLVTGTGSTWSSVKIQAQVQATFDSLVNGAPGTMDTMKELADALVADEGILSTVVSALAKRVRVDAAQTFTAAEKQQALDNLGAVSRAEVGNPSFDYSAYYQQQKAV